jgi:hypothetical protein
MPTDATPVVAHYLIAIPRGSAPAQAAGVGIIALAVPEFALPG